MDITDLFAVTRYREIRQQVDTNPFAEPIFVGARKISPVVSTSLLTNHLYKNLPLKEG